MTNFELAQKLAGLGAVTAMGLDGAASSTMAFDGQLLSKPTKGERADRRRAGAPVHGRPGAIRSRPRSSRPADRATLAYKLVRPATVDAPAARARAARRSQLDGGARSPGTYSRSPGTEPESAGGPLDVEGLGDRRSGASLGRGAPVLAELDAQVARASSRVADHRHARARRLADHPNRDAPAPSCARSLKRQADAGATAVTWDGRLAGKLAPRAGRTWCERPRRTRSARAELTATVRRQ